LAFVIRIYHDAWSSECQILQQLLLFWRSVVPIGNYQLTQQNVPEDFIHHVEHYFDII